MMVRRRQPSSSMVCLSGCVLHQSSRRYLRSVTCSASWLDSGTSYVEVTGPVAREINPIRGGCTHVADSFGLCLFGCGNALWKLWAFVLFSGVSSSAKMTAKLCTECLCIVKPERKTEQKLSPRWRGIYAQLLRTHKAPQKQADSFLYTSYIYYTHFRTNIC